MNIFFFFFVSLPQVFTGSVVHLFKIEDQHKLFSFFDGALKPVLRPSQFLLAENYDHSEWRRLWLHHRQRPPKV